MVGWCIPYIPSWELTYPSPKHFWRWFSFSRGGMCMDILEGIVPFYRTFVHFRGCTSYQLSQKTPVIPTAAWSSLTFLRFPRNGGTHLGSFLLKLPVSLVPKFRNFCFVYPRLPGSWTDSSPMKKILPIPKGKEVKHFVFQQNHGFFRAELLLNFRGCIYLANWASNKNRHDFPPLKCVKFPTSPMVGRMDLWWEFVQVHRVQLKAFLWHMKAGSGYGWQPVRHQWVLQQSCFFFFSEKPIWEMDGEQKNPKWVVYLIYVFYEISGVFYIVFDSNGILYI